MRGGAARDGASGMRIGDGEGENVGEGGSVF